MTALDQPKQDPAPPSFDIPTKNPPGWTDEAYAQWAAQHSQMFEQHQQQMLHGLRIQGAQRFREQHPAIATIADIGNVPATLATQTIQQGLVNPIQGGMNLFRNNPLHFNVRDFATEIMGGSPEIERAMEETASPTAKFARGAAELGGDVAGMFAPLKIGSLPVTAYPWMYGGLSKLYMKGLTKVSTKLAENPGVARALANGLALGTTTLESSQSDTLGGRAEQAAYMAISTPLFEGATALINKGFGIWLRDPKARAQIDSMSRWARDTGVRPQMAGESVEEYQKRAIDGWVAAGTPGLAKTWQEIVGDVATHGLEGAALNLMDMEFMGKEFDLAKDGKYGDAFLSFAEHAASNALGMAAARYLAGKSSGQAGDFLAWNLSQPTAKPKATTPHLAEEVVATKQAETARKAAIEGDLGEKVAAAAPGAGLPNTIPEHLERLGIEPAQAPDFETHQAIIDAATQKPVDPVAEMQAAQVEPKKPLPAEAEMKTATPGFKEYNLGGTTLSFKVLEDGTIKGGEKLNKALGLGDTPIEANRFLHALERLSVLDHYQGKWMMPGELYAPGVNVVPSADPAKNPSKMYTVRAGRLFERDARLDSKWKDIGEAKPMRAPDTVDQEQIQAAETLLDIRKQMPPMDSMTNAVLDAMDYALRSVDRSRDVTIGNLVDSINQGVVPHMLTAAGGEPEMLGKAIMQSAQIGATKTADVALADFANEGATQKEAERSKGLVEGLAKAEGQGLVTASVGEASQLARLAPEGSEIGKRLAEVAASGKRGEVPITGEEAQGLSQYYKRRSPGMLRAERQQVESFMAKAAKALNVEAGPKPVLPEEMRMYGGLPIPPALVELAKEGAINGFELARKFLDKTTGDMVDQIRRLGMKPEAKEARAIIEKAATKKAEMAGTIRELAQLTHATDEASRAAREERRAVKWVGNMGFDQVILHRDAPAREYAAKNGIQPVSYGDINRKVDQLQADVHKTTAQWAEDAGMTIQGKDGEQLPWKAPEVANRLVRMPTVRLQEALLRREGKLWETYAAEMAKANGKELAETKQILGDAADRGLFRRDATEDFRYFPIAGSHLMVDGKPAQIYETQPERHAQSLVEHSANRTSWVEAKGQDRELTAAQKKEIKDIGGQLPVPAYKELIRIKDQHGLTAARAYADLMRTMNGMALTMPMLEPGGAASEMWSLLRGAIAVKRAFALSGAAVGNLTELLGEGNAIIGKANIAAALKDVMLASAGIGKGRQALMDELADSGLIKEQFRRTDISETGSAAGDFEAKAQSFAALAQKATLFKYVQDTTNMTMALGAKRQVDGWKENGGSKKDAAMLREMFGFDAADAQKMVDGEAPAELYSQYLHRVVGRLTGGAEKSSAEKAPFQHNRVFQNLFWLQSFAIARATTLRQGVASPLLKALTGKGQGGELALAADVLGSIGVQTAAQTAAVALFGGGLAGLYNLVKDALDETPVEAGLSVFKGIMANYIGGAPLAAMNQNHESFVDAMWHSTSIGSMGKDVYDFASSLYHPDTSNPYFGLNLTQKAAKMLAQVSPLAAKAEKGLFGISAIAMTEEPKLALAMSALHKWEQRHDPGDIGGASPYSDFLANMKQVSVLLRDGVQPGDPRVITALKQAAQAKGDLASVAESLDGKKALAKYLGDKKLPMAVELRKYLGEDQWHTLMAYDHILDYMANAVR